VSIVQNEKPKGDEVMIRHLRFGIVPFFPYNPMDLSYISTDNAFSEDDDDGHTILAPSKIPLCQSNIQTPLWLQASLFPSVLLFASSLLLHRFFVFSCHRH
jgi:hypothetical protein